MQFNTLHFKNVDESVKEHIQKKTAQIFEHLDKDYVVTGAFERSASGEYSAHLDGHSNFGAGDFHAHAKDENVNLMIAALKKKIRSQILEQKARYKKARHGAAVSGDVDLARVPTFEGFRVSSETNTHYNNVPNVLIIDDDLEAIIPIEMIFRDIGCATSFAIERQEAIHKLKNTAADLIILDWMLDSTTGGELIKNISASGEAYTIERGYRPKVITYSGLEDNQIAFPKNRWFEHIRHWTKPINYDEVATEAKKFLLAMGY